FVTLETPPGRRRLADARVQFARRRGPGLGFLRRLLAARVDDDRRDRLVLCRGGTSTQHRQGEQGNGLRHACGVGETGPRVHRPRERAYELARTRAPRGAVFLAQLVSTN